MTPLDTRGKLLRLGLKYGFPEDQVQGYLGTLTDEQVVDQLFEASVGGVPAAPVAAQEWAESRDDDERRDAGPYTLSSVDDLLTGNVPTRPPDLIASIIPADARQVEIVGHEGDGKTLFALIVGMAASVGRPALGLYPVARPLRVLFCEDDTPQAIMQRREFAILRAMHLTEEEKARFRLNWVPVRDPSFVFRAPERLESTLALMERIHRPIDVVVVDSRTTAWVGDPDDPREARWAFLHVIKPLADRFGVRFVILSHPPKARTDLKGNRARLTVAGTVVVQRQADQVLGVWLESDDPPAISLTWNKVRDGARPARALFTADLDPDGMGWCGLRPSNDLRLLDRSALDQVRAELLDYIDAAPERSRKECITHVRATLSLADRTTDEALAQLVRDKKLAKGTRGREATYHRPTFAEEPS